MKSPIFTYAALLVFLVCGSLKAVAADTKTTREQDWTQLVADARLLFPGPGVHITGFAIGVAGTPGEFFVLSQKMLQVGTSDDFEALLNDSNMALRAFGVVGFVRLNQKLDKAMVEQTLQGVLADKTQIAVTSSGCMGDNYTMSTWAQEFLQNPGMLGHDYPGGVPKPSDTYFLANAFYYRAEGLWGKKDYSKARDNAEAGLRQLGFEFLPAKLKAETDSQIAKARTQIAAGQIAEGSQLLYQTLRVRLDAFFQKDK